MTVRLSRSYATSVEARRLAAALAADNPPFVRVEVVDRTIVVRLRARSAASARATLDDLLACAQAAERAGAIAGPPASRTRGAARK